MTVPDVEWVDDIDSTNAELLRRHRALPARFALAARRQRAGRGRQGRHWLSPEGNLYLSVFARLRTAAAGLSGMSLAVGISVCEAVRARGIERAQVKWPNDLQVDGAKLGGVLIEIASAGSDGSAVVIGLGLNLAMPPDHAPDQAWTDLHQLGIDVDPCTWASCMTEAIVAAVDRFDAEGLDAFHDRWDAIDALRGRGVEVQGAQSVSGTARGIDAHGALRVEHAGGMWLCRSGEVRVRAA